VSGLDELTREQLQALVVKLYETVRVQQAEIAEIPELKATIKRQAERIRELEEEVARLRGGTSSAQLRIRPSVPEKEKRPRKKRKGSFARVTLAATQVKVEVTDHLFVQRYCGVCGKRFTADPGVVLGDAVVGKNSVGIGLISVVAHLKTVCRVPIVQIRKLLETLEFAGAAPAEGGF